MTDPLAATAPRFRLPHPRRNPRHFLLDVGLQLRLGGYLVSAVAAVASALAWQLWRAYGEASRLVAQADPQASDAMAAVLSSEDRSRMAWIGGIMALVAVALLVMAVVATHRIAGPAHAIAGMCRTVADGSLEVPRRLRRGDHLTKLADEVGLMVDALRAREEEERVWLVEAAQAMKDEPVRAKAIVEEIATEKARRLRR